MISSLDFKTHSTSRERYSVPPAARNPEIIQDCELESEDIAAMIPRACVCACMCAPTQTRYAHDVDSKETSDWQHGMTALMVACASGHHDAAKMLVPPSLATGAL